jgi:arginine-tRNA-protein transferase
MAAAVVRDLQQTTKLPETHWQEPPPDEPGEHPGKPHELRVERVEAHEPSGQVLVHVRVDSAVLEPHKSASRGDDEKDGGDDDDDVRMLHSDEEDHRPRHPRPRNDDEDDDARKTRGESNADGESRKADDRIGDWWRSRAALVAPESRSAGSASAAASVRWSRLMAAAGHDRAQGSVLRGPPPYVMSVTTLPAHESALDPDVHQLYWEYQHVVHGDPDPLEGVPEAPQAARGSVSHPPFINPGKHGADMSSNENAADQEMMNNMSDSNDDGESEDEDASSLGRWGRNAPDGWLSRAHAMLEAAYPLTFSGSHTSSASPESHLQQSRRKILARFGHFYEFLVENPFDSQPQGPAVSHERGGIGAAYTSKSKDGGNHLPPGSYHQHYRVGDVLVAVGVVDVLPQGLSSVYLFYDPAFARDAIPMGKYAILREIEYTRDILRLPCYYLGYYIESCPKMRYKIEYKPSELLCPVTFRWVDAEQGRQLLLLNSPQRNCCQLYFGSDVEVGNDDASPKSSLPTALEQIVMDVGVGYPVTLTLLQPQGRSMVEPILREFVQEAGSRVAPLCTILFL